MFSITTLAMSAVCSSSPAELKGSDRHADHKGRAIAANRHRYSSPNAKIRNRRQEKAT
jgi:hypothetical protein